MRARRAVAALAVLVVAIAAGAALRAAAGGQATTVPGRLSALPGRPRSTDTRFSPRAVLSTRGRHLIARVRGRRLTVRARPSAHAHPRVLRGRTFDGQRLPLVLLVKRRRDDWLEAYLPARPNRSTGWIRVRDVRLSQTAYRIEVRLRSHRLVLWRGRRAVLRTPIATGRAVSPTPTGRYFVTELIRPPDPHGFFGPYALGLSAHSDVYTRFEGGDGQVGVHGTDRPDALGHDVSHGCIRVRNRAIDRLARTVPLGTPVDIARR